jgi:hypothetical protein
MEDDETRGHTSTEDTTANKIIMVTITQTDKEMYFVFD